MNGTWSIDGSDFYELESYEEQMQFLLRYAILAPSARNTQPWSFRITPEGVEVHADFSRRLMIVDRDDRELLMSIGAAITNFRVAAAHFGFETTVLYDNRAEESAPVALIAVRETCAPDARLAELFSAIRRRHTNRAPFTGRSIDPAAVAAICDAVDAEPQTLCLILPRDREAVAGMTESAERTLMARPAFRAELADWIRAAGQGSDGVSGEAFGLPRPLAGAGSWLMRNFDGGAVHARRDRRLADSASVLLAVTADDDRVSLVRAGEVLERLLLTLTAAGLQYSFLNQAIEVDETRNAMRVLIGSNQPPQLLLRIGTAAESAEATPRRAVESVIV